MPKNVDIATQVRDLTAKAREAERQAAQLTQAAADARREHAEGRSNAIRVRAFELIRSYVDGDLATEMNAAAQRFETVQTIYPVDWVAILDSHTEARIKSYVRAQITDHLASEIWQHSGRPMLENYGSAPSRDLIRAGSDTYSNAPAVPGIESNLFDHVADRAKSAALSAAMAYVTAELNTAADAA